MNSEDILIQKLQDYFPKYKIEKGAAMRYSLRGSEYYVLHQSLPNKFLVQDFEPAEVFICMLRKELLYKGEKKLVSIRVIESGVDVVNNDYYFYLRLCLEDEAAPIIYERGSDAEGYKLRSVN